MFTGSREAIEDVIESDLGIFATGFTAGDHALRLLKSDRVNENDVLLFGCGDRNPWQRKAFEICSCVSLFRDVFIREAHGNRMLFSVGIISLLLTQI